jgi:hypothetical protein
VIESFKSVIHTGPLKGDKPKEALIPRLRNDYSCHGQTSVNRADLIDLPAMSHIETQAHLRQQEREPSKANGNRSSPSAIGSEPSAADRAAGAASGGG